MEQYKYKEINEKREIKPTILFLCINLGHLC